MKRLHDLRHSLPAIAADQATSGLERGKMALCVETIAALAPFSRRQQAQALVVAHLLNADSCSSGEINSTQSMTKFHVKLSGPLYRLLLNTFLFISHDTRTLPLLTLQSSISVVD